MNIKLGTNMVLRILAVYEQNQLIHNTPPGGSAEIENGKKKN